MISCSMNLKKIWFANLPSLNQIRWLAQSERGVQVLARFKWKSPLPCGNKQGKAREKYCLVLNSDIASFFLVGQGMQTWPFLLALTVIFIFSDISLTAFSMISFIFILGCGRLTPETVSPWISPGSIWSIAGPCSLRCCVSSLYSKVLMSCSSPSRGNQFILSWLIIISEYTELFSFSQ